MGGLLMDFSLTGKTYRLSAPAQSSDFPSVDPIYYELGHINIVFKHFLNSKIKLKLIQSGL
ncbi:hypothetical protein CHA01nite_06660 [Chryseobacterium hagamense]|uniref:Uncharacterized protein n=1 Tax=Chryseobacterium hagamense TaxID=395935 RepID=A0A511YIF2_9FLAO|nr:hypothetical protein CHA01nite_06660 [Chryseobacterium hagamense]